MGNSLNNENFWQLVIHNQPQSILADSHRIVGCYGNHSAKSEEVLKFSKKNKKQGVPCCWVFVKQFSRNDTATACQDWLRIPG